MQQEDKRKAIDRNKSSYFWQCRIDYDRAGRFLERLDLQKRSERRATYRTVVRLVSERVSARIAQTQMSARQNQRVAHLAYADNAFGTVVLGVLVAALLLEKRKKHSKNNK